MIIVDSYAIVEIIEKRYVPLGASLIAQLVKNLPAMQETWVQSLDRDNSPGEGKSYPLQYSGLENSMDCPWRPKELDTIE